MENIILIGFMGCGKSTVGICLSYKMKCVLEDTDKRIEKEQGKTISQIFEENGENFFRDLETECLKNMIEESSKKIISVGGGLPVREENRRLLQQLGTVIYLRITPGKVLERLEGDTTRPLLQCNNPIEKIENLMNERAPLYEECANYIIDVDEKNINEISKEIVRICENV